MADLGSKRPKRSGVAARFDEITLAVFTALVIVAVAAVFIIGVSTAEDRLGCELNSLVNRLLAYSAPSERLLHDIVHFPHWKERSWVENGTRPTLRPCGDDPASSRLDRCSCCS